MGKMIDITEAAELLGVVSKTLRRWDDTGKFKAVRTFGNHRRYRMEDIEAIINSQEIKTYQSTQIKADIKKSLKELENERDENSEDNCKSLSDK